MAEALLQNPLRIVVPMLFYHPDHPSGSVKLAFEEALYLARMGHEVWVVTQDPDGTQPEYALRDGLHVLHYQSPKPGLFSPRRMSIHQQMTRDLLKKYVPQADVVHGHSLLHYDGALSHYGKSTRRVYSVHSPVKLEIDESGRGVAGIRKAYYVITAQLTHRIERRILNRSDVITSDSAYTRDKLGELHGAKLKNRVQVVPGWVNVDEFTVIKDREAVKQRFGWPVDVPVLFTLRRLVPRNGIDRLVQALKIVRDAGHAFHMVIGGGGPLKSDLEALAAELGLSERVRFLGFVPDADLPLMYGACDLFVLPTSALECFGLITLEALATGRPVVATPVAAIPEVMNAVEPQWLTRDATPEAIAECLIAYLKGELPHHAPEALRLFVVRHYDRDRVIKQLVEVAFGKA